jgi:2-dehydro-3-deoxyphosphogluconate aldolase/(4S)-4-hydroxy-2-oxoglutarate aldolase
VEAAAYLKAGAVAVGVGSPLVGDAADGGDLLALTDRAQRLLDAIDGAR